MAAQPHIPYAILPKRFEPKQISSNGFSQQQQQQLRSSNNINNNNNTNNNNNRRFPRRQPNTNFQRSQRQQDYYDDQWIDADDDLWLEPMSGTMRRRPNRNAAPMNAYYGPRVMIIF